MQTPNLSQVPVLVLLPLLLGVFVVPLLGLWRRRLAYFSTLTVVVAFAGVGFVALKTVLEQGPQHYRMAGWVPPVGIELVLDGLSAFLVLVIGVVALMVTIYAGTAVRRENPEREVAFYSMFVMLLMGLVGIVMTGDLFNLYVFFEVSALSAYALMAVGGRKAPVSAYRYLLQGTIGASFYLIGVGYLYVLTGSLNMADVAGRLPELIGNPALSIAVVFMLAGVGLKMALFPLHLWLPDAYTYASSTSTAIIAPVMTKVSAYVLIRVIYFVYDSEWVLGQLHLGAVLSWLAMTGVVWGSIMALAQTDPKRMLAYSSIAQVGYIGVGLGTGNPLALAAAVLHIMNHAAMKSCLFLVTGSIELQTGIRSIQGWTGLGRRMPWTFLGFTLAAAAMVGIPPTSGFFSKWYLALGLAEEKQWVLLVILILSGLLTAGYFARIIERVFARVPADVESADQSASSGVPTEKQRVDVRAVGEDRAAQEAGAANDAHEAPLGMVFPVVFLGLATLVLGLVNSWFETTVNARALPASMSWPGLGG